MLIKRSSCYCSLIYILQIYYYFLSQTLWQNSLLTGLNQPRTNKLLTIFRGEVTSASIAADFQAGPLYWSNLQIECGLALSVL